MKLKTITSIVIAVAFTILLIVIASTTHADEVVPQKKPIELKIQTTVDSIKTWANNEWVEIVEYQKAGWADGKEQFAKNKEQFLNLFKKD